MSNAMINIVAHIKAQPGHEDAFKAALTTLAEATRREPECRTYVLHQVNADPAHFVTYETWDSQAGADAHMTTPHSAAAIGAIGQHLAAPLEIISLTPVA
jgi:quinol monooxygenase YgiN